MSDRQESFRGLYSAHVDAVLGYALRRVDRSEDPGDIVSETEQETLRGALARRCC